MLGHLLNKEIFLRTLIVLSVAEIVSLLAYTVPVVNWLLLPLLIIGCLWLFWRYPAWIIYAPFVEVIWGSLGRTFYWPIGEFSLSLRMLIFGLSLIGWLWQRPDISHLPWRNRLFQLYCLTLITVFWGAGLAWFRTIDPALIFADGNGYLYLLWPMIWLSLGAKISKPMLMSMGLAAVIMVSLKTLVIFHLFTHAYDWANIGFLYLWIRDTKVGELTLVTANYWRVFFQSHLYPSLAWLLLTLYHLLKPSSRLSLKLFLCLTLTFTSIVLSLSRSFWLALALSLGVSLFINAARLWKQTARIKRLLQLSGSMLAGLLLIGLLLFIPPVDTDLAAALANRLGSGEAAVTSRANLLPVMIQGIQKHWWSGAGLGAELTYRNTDPRVRDLAGQDGMYTTYAFEFGWLDFWYKFGLFGLLIWLAVFGSIMLKLLKLSRIKAPERPLIMACAAMVLFLASTHLVTPYLNHPIGLGFLTLVISSIVSYEQQQ